MTDEEAKTFRLIARTPRGTYYSKFARIGEDGENLKQIVDLLNDIGSLEMFHMESEDPKCSVFLSRDMIGRSIFEIVKS